MGLATRETGGKREYYIFNAHGDVVRRMDTAGNEVKAYDYDAFGNENAPDAGGANVFRYCGEYFDKETGNVYLRARYYNPGIGRFGTQDPAMDGLNWCVYCWNNPILFADANGKDPYTVNGINNQYDLWISPQWLEGITTGIGVIPVVGAATSAGIAGLQHAIGTQRIDPDYGTQAGLGIDLLGKALKNPVAKQVVAGAGWIVSGASAIPRAYDWLRTHKYQMQEAAYNSIDYDAWLSDSRKLVEEKYYFAMQETAYLMDQGEIGVKKGEDMFSTGSFSDGGDILGMYTYQYDPLTDKKKIYQKDKYYFYAIKSSAKGKLSDLHKVIKAVK